ncbi:MAG: DUF445 family protein [Gemmatimonadota bacterium]
MGVKPGTHTCLFAGWLILDSRLEAVKCRVRCRTAIRQAVTASGSALLVRPIGRPSSWLGPEATGALRQSAHDRAWTWIEEQVPQVVAKLSIQEMVEEKVLGFSTEKMEEIVRRVTQKELDLIVKLGYLFGAMLGAIAFGVNQLLT